MRLSNLAQHLFVFACVVVRMIGHLTQLTQVNDPQSQERMRTGRVHLGVVFPPVIELSANPLPPPRVEGKLNPVCRSSSHIRTDCASGQLRECLGLRLTGKSQYSTKARITGQAAQLLSS